MRSGREVKMQRIIAAPTSNGGSKFMILNKVKEDKGFSTAEEVEQPLVPHFLRFGLVAFQPRDVT